MSQLLQYYKQFQEARKPAPVIAPTFEDLAIDDNLSELQRLVRYARSSIGLQRLVHVKMLAHVASSVGFSDTNKQIMPLLDALSQDSERAVKQHLTEQLSLLAKLCFAHGEDGYNDILNHILPVIGRLLEDDESEVRQSACSTIAEVAKLIRPEDLGQHVLTIILRLAHEDDKEEMRMTACELLNSMAECLGSDLCKQFVIPEVVSLAEDPVFRVRKATALNFHNICNVGGEHELFERLMPAFVRLSKDDMYRVRRACAESLSDISKNVSDDIRIGVLVEIYLRLTQDPSRLVKQSILQQSGMFIATLPSRAVNEMILGHFCSMASNPTGDMSVDSELRHFCAYSFPAVMQTVGCKRWKEVRELYRSLVTCRSANVKHTLATSLHEIARILGEGKIVEEELVPVFEDMIQDVEIVQMGVIKHLAEFLSFLSEPCRVSYLPILHDILHRTNPFNWRLRQSLAHQLPELLMLTPECNVFQTLFPLVMTLLQDPVAGVRIESFKGVAKMIKMLTKLAEIEEANEIANCDNNNKDNNELEYEDGVTSNNKCRKELDAFIQSINSLIHADVYQMRQLWIELSHRLLRDLSKELFEKYFIDGLLILTTDRVSNVRVALAIVFGGWFPEDYPPWTTEEEILSKKSDDSISTRLSPWSWLMQRHDIKVCIHRLANDDNDVYLNVSKLQPIFRNIKFKSMSCRGRKVAPGGAAKIHNSTGYSLEEYIKLYPENPYNESNDSSHSVNDISSNSFDNDNDSDSDLENSSFEENYSEEIDISKTSKHDDDVILEIRAEAINMYVSQDIEEGKVFQNIEEVTVHTTDDLLKEEYASMDNKAIKDYEENDTDIDTDIDESNKLKDNSKDEDVEIESGLVGDEEDKKDEIQEDIIANNLETMESVTVTSNNSIENDFILEKINEFQSQNDGKKNLNEENIQVEENRGDNQKEEKFEIRQDENINLILPPSILSDDVSNLPPNL